MTTHRELFTPLCQLQLPSHCGPCSLSASLFILGINASQRQLARAAGRDMQVFLDGVDEIGLRRAARSFGVKSEFLLYKRESMGEVFARRLRDHLRGGNSAVLLTRDFDHWVAVIGYLPRQRRFIVVDPKVEHATFFRWSQTRLIRRAWNQAPATAPEPSQYFVILLSRADGAPAKWRLSEEWLRLCARGSEDTADGMANDLAEIAHLASPDNRSIEDGPYLAEILEDYEESILAGITHWALGNGRARRGDLRAFYRDYKIVASSTGMRISADADRPFLVAQLTALLCSYWWGASF